MGFVTVKRLMTSLACLKEFVLLSAVRLTLMQTSNMPVACLGSKLQSKTLKGARKR